MANGCETDRSKDKRSIELPVLASQPVKERLEPESTMGKWRAVVLITLTLLMVVHFVQWQITGSTISPIEPSEAMYTLQRGTINAGFIFFTLAILSTLILGRFVCGWGCHIVALQDFCGWLMKKVGITPRPFRSRLLVYVPLIAAFYMFAWPTLYRYLNLPKDEPLFPQFTNHLITTNFWETFPPFFVAVPFLFVVGFMTVYFLGAKGFCTYGCPYGGIFGVADKFAPARIRVTDACEECGHCTAVCTSNVIVHREVKEYGMVVDPGCMKCMDCVSACPTDALYFGFGRPALGVKAKVERNYSLTWPEEIAAALAFVLSMWAVWDVYQLVPMLMALGWAAISTFLFVRLVKLARSKNNTFLKYLLRSQGRLKPAGWIFLIGAGAWLALTAHSGFIRFNERAGAVAFQNLEIPDELALATADPSPWLSAADRRTIADGRSSYLTAMRFGLLSNIDALPKLAWFEYLSGHPDRAVEFLDEAIELGHGEGRSLSQYYKGAILNRMGRHEAALASLNEAVKGSPSLMLAAEERGEALWQLGRRQEAANTWKAALEKSSTLVLANYQLAGAALSGRDAASAAMLEQRGQRLTPNDPLFHWVLGQRLENIGMRELAEKNFARAVELDPSLAARRNGGSPSP